MRIRARRRSRIWRERRRGAAAARRRALELDRVRYSGVTVEASYDVGEYDVSILSAQESDGLVNCLTDNGYKIPAGAEAVLGSYIKQNMRFFVAKVNLERMQQMGNGYLRPLQVRYETPKFMLPLRLGTVNANGPQDLIIYALTKNGRVETTQLSHREAALRHRRAAVRQERVRQVLQGDVRRAVERENMRAVFVEYAWDMGWCDPCAADPMTNKELVELGARWIASDDDKPFRGRAGRQRLRDAAARALRRADVPRGLVLLETKDRTQFPGPLRAAPSVEGQRRPARRARSTAPRCRRASSRRPRTSPISPAGRRAISRRGWRRPGSRRRREEKRVVV